MATEWMVKAACRDLPDTLFFAEKSDHWSQVAAKVICARCPVVAECLQYAFDHNEDYGVWGNTTPRERRRMRKAQQEPAEPEMEGLDVVFVWVDELEGSDG